MTRFTLRFLLPLALLLSAANAHAQALHTSPVESIVAVVEEDVILRSELDAAIRNVHQRFAGRSEQLPPDHILEKQVLESLIMMRLQLQRAEALGVRVSDLEVDQTLARIAEQQGATIDDMRRQLERDGTGFESFREQVRDELLVSRLQQNFVQSRVSVTDGEIDNALASWGSVQDQVHLGYLLVALPDGATPEQIKLAETKADGIYKLIESGEMEFTAAAVRYSDHQTALEGGDMGWRSRDEIPPMFLSSLETMGKGDTSRPIRGQSGFSMIHVLDTREDRQEIITEYHARGIFVRATELVSHAEAKTRIEGLRARITAGEDFAKVAREASDDTMTRAQGGDMGWFPIQAWGGAIAGALENLSQGELSEPFASDSGWHMIELLGTREQDVTEALMRAQMRETIVRRKADEEYDRFLRELRSESYIDERLGQS